MFRREPPLSTSVQAELVDYTGLAALEYTVKLIRLEVEGLPKSKSYTVRIDVVNGEQVLTTHVRGPAVSLTNSNNVLSTFKFKTKDSNTLRVRELNTLAIILCILPQFQIYQDQKKLIGDVYTCCWIEINFLKC